MGKQTHTKTKKAQNSANKRIQAQKRQYKKHKLAITSTKKGEKSIEQEQERVTRGKHNK